jgi:hypothetical protein
MKTQELPKTEFLHVCPAHKASWQRIDSEHKEHTLYGRTRVVSAVGQEAMSSSDRQVLLLVKVGTHGLEFN